LIRDSGDMITLFAEEGSLRRGVSSVAVSGIVHGLAVGALSYGLLRVPRVKEPIITERYSVRHLDLHSPQLREDASASGKSLYPQAQTTQAKIVQASAAVIPESRLPEVPRAVEGKQTLVQPEFHPHVALSEEALVPTVVIWTPELASTKQIVPPLPDKPSTADAQPSLDAPNEELDPGELAVTPADSQPDVQMPPAGSTSPLVVHADSEMHPPPTTVSNSADRPTPTAVISISDVRMTEGTVVLPPVNETHSTPPNSDPAPVVTTHAQAPASAPGSGESTGSQTAAGTGGPAQSGNGSDTETTEHIQLPKDGRFGVIVVGTTLAEEYPETLQIWSDRVAYTVYLHVGLTRNWILQYAQSRTAEAVSNGTVARLEAPWPYDILRPNLVSRDLNADALMVHGILNESGRLESLAIAFPQQFSHADFVLRTLQEWQFRPARQLGKPTSVEVLLIIPDELD